MNSALWIVQGLLAAVFTISGAVKLTLPRDRLQERMHWAATWPPARIKLLGLAELAGAAGLVLPGMTGLAPALTPLAAICLAVLMAGAIRTHHQHQESFAPAALVGLLCVGVAVGRWLGVI